MIITCGQCQAKFKVAPEQIKESGSKVRCSNCQYVFMVYRPQKPAGTDVSQAAADPAPLADEGFGQSGGDPEALTAAAADLARDALDKYLRSLEERDGDQPASGPPAEDDNLVDAYDDDFQDPEDGLDQYVATEDEGPHLRPPGDRLSLKERRDRRRRLYSDLEKKPPEDALEEPEDLYEDFGDEGGRPPLRRTARPRRAVPAPAEESETGEDEAPENYDDYDESAEYDDSAEPYDETEDYDEAGDYGDEEYDESADDDGSGEDDGYDESEGYDDYDQERDQADAGAARPLRSGLGGRSGALGLGHNPAEGGRYIDDADYNPRSSAPSYGALREPTTIRAAVERAAGRSPIRLIAALVILAVILGGAIFYLTRPGPTALSDGGNQSAGNPEGETGRGGDDPNGKEHITFAAQQSPSHFIRDNIHAGKILVITGMVRNSYPENRSFIRLRGHILSAEGATLADRYVFAGNMISEEDLAQLPMSEILIRLSLNAGQNGVNMNIPPEHEIPFMMVFDKLPDGMAEYRIDPVGSSPAN
ncbi:MAG: zinc-ribbon domain-containing protein [Candidatus Adiutrix sp.]|jgi:predicted Zn finger-like uncharacterized protein|nr:zinc-ribbon domain-containing protein [Candidatus Adiutrix sp.]